MNSCVCMLSDGASLCWLLRAGLQVAAGEGRAPSPRPAAALLSDQEVIQLRLVSPLLGRRCRRRFVLGLGSHHVFKDTHHPAGNLRRTTQQRSVDHTSRAAGSTLLRNTNAYFSSHASEILI